MKTIFIISIAIVALTSAATAHTWMWFQGDIGVRSSPVISSSSTNGVAVQAKTKKEAVHKRAVTKNKSKADQRITAR